MKRLSLLFLPLLLVACDNPVEPSSVDERNPINITNIILIDGDEGCQIDCGKGGDDGEPDPTPNSAPFINPIPTQTNSCGDNVSLAITGFDADGDNLTWTWEANSAPRNLTLQSTGPASALISGSITSSSAEDSPHTPRVIASDGKAETSTVFLWNVTCDEPV